MISRQLDHSCSDNVHCTVATGPKPQSLPLLWVAFKEQPKRRIWHRIRKGRFCTAGEQICRHSVRPRRLALAEDITYTGNKAERGGGLFCRANLPSNSILCYQHKHTLLAIRHNHHSEAGKKELVIGLVVMVSLFCPA